MVHSKYVQPDAADGDTTLQRAKTEVRDHGWSKCNEVDVK